LQDTNENNTPANVPFWLIGWQLLKEFILPVVITFCWVLWDGKGKTNYDYVGKFFLLIMSISYLFLQWHRVKKQLRTDRGLSALEQGVADMLQKMEIATKDIVGYATGGDSVCWLEPSRLHALTGEFMIHHQGKYPLRDIHFRVVDLERLAAPEHQITALTENIFTLNLIIPNHVRMISLNSPLERSKGDRRGFNIFITTPSGSYSQLLRIARVDGVLKCAVLLETDAGTILEKVDDAFPRKEDGTVDWDEHPIPKSAQGKKCEDIG
jgi:hypothetical protein